MIYMCKVKTLETCLKEYELNPAHFLLLTGLAWQACLKKTVIQKKFHSDTKKLL